MIRAPRSKSQIPDMTRLPRSFYFVSLGCPKNRVDTEVAAASLLAAGLVPAAAAEKADLLVVNTCSFVLDARQESIETLGELAAIKRSRPGARLVAMGCLAQQDPAWLSKAVPELDLIAGTGCVDRILPLLAGTTRIAIDVPTFLPDYDTPRVLSQSRAFAYLKIGDGCSRKCAFCTIPSIKGPFVSRPISRLVDEARQLCAMGAKELVLVAQDTTQFGRPDKHALLRLIDELERIPGIEWIRLMYLYPDAVGKSLLRRMAERGKLLPYLDMPVQHISDGLLRTMRRQTTARKIRSVIDSARDICPEITLRTTVITGLPGESRDDFADLLEFVETTKFAHLGAFAFSPEPGTPAASMPGQVAVEERNRRRAAVMRVQRYIARSYNRGLVGQAVRVLIEGDADPQQVPVCDVRGTRTPAGETGLVPDGPVSVGRIASQAPEVDGSVFVFGAQADGGQIVDARIAGYAPYDLVAVATAGKGARGRAGRAP